MRHGNRRGTPFWGFSQRAVELLEPGAGGPWLSRYAWWNVYPLGWQDRHGTPTGDLHATQTPFVADLFWAVAEELEVKRLLRLRQGLVVERTRVAWPPGAQRRGEAGHRRGDRPWDQHRRDLPPGRHMAGVTRDTFARAAVEAMTERQAKG